MSWVLMLSDFDRPKNGYITNLDGKIKIDEWAQNRIQKVIFFLLSKKDKNFLSFDDNRFRDLKILTEANWLDPNEISNMEDLGSYEANVSNYLWQQKMNRLFQQSMCKEWPIGYLEANSDFEFRLQTFVHGLWRKLVSEILSKSLGTEIFELLWWTLTEDSKWKDIYHIIQDKPVEFIRQQVMLEFLCLVECGIDWEMMVERWPHPKWNQKIYKRVMENNNFNEVEPRFLTWNELSLYKKWHPENRGIFF